MFFLDLLSLAYVLLEQIIVAARAGQLLPQLTLGFIVQLILHLIISTSLDGGEIGWGSPLRLQHASLILLLVTGITNLCGYALLIALYRHSVQTIFNRNLPSTLAESLPSFSAHLSLLKPLEAMFRYATARFRVLPDILVLGEVRCGTTTLCQHLSSIDGCEPPFCLWKHPELDHKETFYFVGHYLGRVNPYHYRMCFPLAIVKWFRQQVLRQPFFTYDGCAQYLTNPAVPHLIAKAYRDAGLPPPILVACVRDPVDQALSWWRYENNAMLWGHQMDLSQWNTELRTPLYPPLTISGALAFSSSETVEEAYRMTEGLFTGGQCTYILPSWAMTWPGGQLSGIGRNGHYMNNIRRYERVFSEAFPNINTMKHGPDKIPTLSQLRFVNVVPLESLGKEDSLKSTLMSLMSQVDGRQGSFASLQDKMKSFHTSNQIHRNATGNMSATSLEPTSAEAEQLKDFFSEDSKELGDVTGLKLDWMAAGSPPSC